MPVGLPGHVSSPMILFENLPWPWFGEEPVCSGDADWCCSLRVFLCTNALASSSKYKHRVWVLRWKRELIEVLWSAVMYTHPSFFPFHLIYRICFRTNSTPVSTSSTFKLHSIHILMWAWYFAKISGSSSLEKKKKQWFSSKQVEARWKDRSVLSSLIWAAFSACHYQQAPMC